MGRMNSSAEQTVCIVGAGASGLACAIACAQELERSGRRAGVRIVVLEQASKAGKSILASGNGRCNFSNARIDVSEYRNAPFAEQTHRALAALPAQGVLPWFKGLGLAWREAPATGGLLYPFSNKASTVLAVLLAACKRYGVQILTEQRVQGIEQRAESFVVSGQRGVEVGRKTVGKKLKKVKREVEWEPFSLTADVVVVAAGGVPDEALVCGVPLCPPHPVLGPLAATFAGGSGCGSSGPSPAQSLEALDGVRVHAKLTIDQVGFSEEGEVLFRPYGLSGIVAFNASRVAAPNSKALLDLAPEYSEEGLRALLHDALASSAAPTWSALLEGFFVPAVAAIVLYQAGYSANEVPQEAGLGDVAAAAKGLAFSVQGVEESQACQVTRGGCAVSAFDPATLEARTAGGLYVLGEALDVDGPCGGYNLDWAWTCGIVAGTHIGRRFS